MTTTVVYQDPYVVNTVSEMGQISIDKPNISPMTQCTVLVGSSGGTEVYRWNNGQWNQTYPDQPTIDWLTQHSTDIATLQTGRAETSAITTALQTTVTALSSSVSTKADASTLSTLQATVSALAATIPPANIALVPASATRAIVTSNVAGGFRPSTAYNTFAVYNLKVQTTANISGNSDGYVVAEICATNSNTPGDWLEVPRSGNAQALSLAVVLQSIQGVTTSLALFIPKGWYCRIRTVSTTGTVTFTYISGTETPMS